MAKKKAVRMYRVEKGFNLKIPMKDKDRDFGSGYVIAIADGLEVRYDIGMKVSAVQLPKIKRDVFQWLVARGCLVKAGVQEAKTDG